MTANDDKNPAAGGDTEKNNTPPAEPKAPAAKGDAKAPAALKWYKVKSGCINGVLHSAKFPYVQLTEDKVKAYGKEYINPKGYATEKECPLEAESDED